MKPRPREVDRWTLGRGRLDSKTARSLLCLLVKAVWQIKCNYIITNKIFTFPFAFAAPASLFLAFSRSPPLFPFFFAPAPSACAGALHALASLSLLSLSLFVLPLRVLKQINVFVVRKIKQQCYKIQIKLRKLRRETVDCESTEKEV